MKRLTFKTNINCGGCVAKVTPFLNDEANICEWNVDTASPDKVLTVEGENITSEDVEKVVKKSGFKIEKIN